MLDKAICSSDFSAFWDFIFCLVIARHCSDHNPSLFLLRFWWSQGLNCLVFFFFHVV